MGCVIAAGVAVIDFVLQVDEMPSKPVKYRAKEATIVGGGCAATAAVTARRLGFESYLITRLGDDAIGKMIVEGLEADGVDCSLLKRFEGRNSWFSSVFIDKDGERLIVGYRDQKMDPGAGWVEELDIPPFDAAVADTRWPKGSAALLKLARERGVPGVLDAESHLGDGREAVHLASHVAFSTNGLREISGTHDIESGLRAAKSMLGNWVCVTNGANGTFWLEGDSLKHEASFEIDVVDTLGAGDVWHGAFALALGEKMDEGRAVRFANAVASLKCSRFGGRAGVPTRDEVETFMKQAGRSV